MAAVQFYGADEVIQAADNAKCAAWGIFQGSQFLFKFEEQDQAASLQFLQNVLESLRRSEAIYTIRFYEPEKGKELKIKQNTPYDGSFNFKLIEPEERESRRMGYIQTNNYLEARVKELEGKLAGLEEQEEEEPETIGAVLLGLLKQPDELTKLANIFRSFKGQEPLPIPAQTVGTVPDSITPVQPSNEEERLTRLGNAIDTLEKHDPLLLEHLEKLAKMATDQPEQFKLLIGML